LEDECGMNNELAIRSIIRIMGRRHRRSHSKNGAIRRHDGPGMTGIVRLDVLPEQDSRQSHLNVVL
jgi:hypothetical protein